MQEAKIQHGAAAAVEARMASTGWKAAVAPAVAIAGGGVSRGLVTLTRRQHGLGRPRHRATHVLCEGRASVHTFSGGCRRGLLIINIYLEVGGALTDESWGACSALWGASSAI